MLDLKSTYSVNASASPSTSTHRCQEACKRLVIAKECKQAINYDPNIESKVIESRKTGTFNKYDNQKLANKCSVGLLFDESGVSGCPVINDIDKASLLNDYFSLVNITDDGKLPPLQSRR